MSTTRRKRSRKPAQNTPEWAEKLIKTGQKPQKGDPGFDQFVGWHFFDEAVHGLPPAHEFYPPKIWKPTES